jgi:hypothetical protein
MNHSRVSGKLIKNMSKSYMPSDMIMAFTECINSGEGESEGVIADESRKIELSICALQLWPTRVRLPGSNAGDGCDKIKLRNCKRS